MPDSPFHKAVPHPFKDHTPTGVVRAASAVRYAELTVTTNYTFLTGASHPEEMVRHAAALGHTAVAIADTNTLAGIVRAHVAARDLGIPIALGCRLALRDPLGLKVLVYPTDRAAYARLCRLLTFGKRRAPKGECDLSLHDLIEHSAGLLAVVDPPATLDEAFLQTVRGLRGVFDDDRLSLALRRSYEPDDLARAHQIADLARIAGVPLIATNGVRHHAPERRPLQDVLTCIRLGTTVDRAGYRLAPNAERHLKPPEEMDRIFRDCPGAVERSADIALQAAAFGLDQLRYDYPAEPVPDGMTPASYLRALTEAGAIKRYPAGIPATVRAAIEHELALIGELRYEPYFLTCEEIVTFARSRGILCQGRGGAANSAVCYCLGITEVNPAGGQLLFERFISRERGEPPDIDIDFEQERREEVIQHIYAKYGRDHAALTAEVISYRGRSAVREVGKALGLSQDRVDRLAKHLDHWGESANPARIREAGMDPDDPTIRRLLILTDQIRGFPRHLSQHVGGFVITQSPLCELVPVENAAMEDRTVIEWDKDDIDAVGMLKIDCLGLGMLTCIRKALELVGSDGATERRSDEAGEKEDHERRLEDGSDIQGSDRLAAGDATGQRSLSINSIDADGRAIRPDIADASVGGIDPLEHCGGTRTPEPARLPQVSADRTRISGGAQHPNGAGTVIEHDSESSFPTTRGDRSGPPRPDPLAGENAVAKHSHTPPSCPPPSSLRRSVAPSLYSHYAEILKAPSDPSVYNMLCRADAIGVFQVESRAQMSMLPRLRPREFYDLVIEVAIVRPGPIQGGMVHPYLRRRNGEEPITYPNPEIEGVLGRTLGVPLFQEQAMRLAIVAAGFTPDQADKLRRAMAAWKRKGDAIYRFGQQIIEGMLERGYRREFAERCFEQIKGFSEYGFPESHAASFALLVYASAWLKRYHPAAFAAALINSQPMGFYAPAQIVRDAQEHGVTVHPVDANYSAWDCTLEGDPAGKAGANDPPEHWGRHGPAIRLGMRLVSGLPIADADRIAEAVVRRGRFPTVESLWRASGASVRSLRALARADAFGSMGLDRQSALWQTRTLRDERLPLFEQTDATDDTALDQLPILPADRAVVHDYNAFGLSLKAHPMSFVRDHLAAEGVTACADLRDPARCPQGKTVTVAGIVLCRQRPGTASGVVFVTLEDETGIANLIIWRDVFERFRAVVRLARAMRATGRVERQGDVVHLHVREVQLIDTLPSDLSSSSRDFH
ncbi:PHP domain-containing protein [Nodularia spumigena UHCC 0040]|nr:PHP domain-containing protein [Nodularia spumigena]MEA5614864.1 PHP domain-containing protein [Nodularia spumigena UHCC 0040]